MKRIARFEKVSLKQFLEGCERENAEEIYSGIKPPAPQAVRRDTIFSRPTISGLPPTKPLKSQREYG